MTIRSVGIKQDLAEKWYKKLFTTFGAIVYVNGRHLGFTFPIFSLALDIYRVYKKKVIELQRAIIRELLGV